MVTQDYSFINTDGKVSRISNRKQRLCTCAETGQKLACCDELNMALIWSNRFFTCLIPNWLLGGFLQLLWFAPLLFSRHRSLHANLKKRASPEIKGKYTFCTLNVNSGEPDAFLWACMQNMHKCMCAHECAHTHTHTHTHRHTEKFYTQTQIYTHTYTDSKTKIYTYSGLHRQAHKLHIHKV